MNIQFTQDEINQLNEMIQLTPFKYAYPLFLFFQKKVSDAQKAEAEQTVESKPEPNVG